MSAVTLISLLGGRPLIYYVYVLAILTTHISVFSARNVKMQRSTIVRIHDGGNCRDRPVRPFHFTRGDVIIQAKNTYSWSGEGISEKATRSIEMIVINVTKCGDRSKANCEHFQHLEWKSGLTICPLFLVYGAPWSGFVHAFTPSLTCVNHVGKFALKNFTADYKQVSVLFGERKDFWIMQVEYFDHNLSPWMCIRAEFDFPTVRSQSS